MSARLAGTKPRAGPADLSILTVRITAGVLCVVGAVILGLEFYHYIGVFPGPALLAVALELPPLVIGFWVVRGLRPVRSPDLIWSAAALVWGAFAATGCGLLANKGLIAVWAQTAGVAFASTWSASLSAPLNEEVLKVCGVVMIVLAAPRLIRGPVDGMVFGALVGLGFQVAENVTYGLANIVQSGATDPVQAVTSSGALRVLVTGLGSHWTMTAVSGAGIGFLVARERRRQGVALAVACLVMAMGMHLLFDAPEPNLIIKVIVNFVIVTTLYVLLRQSYLDKARRALSGLVASGTVTAPEAATALARRARRRERQQVPRGPHRDQVLARQKAVLGLVEDEVALQARTEPLLQAVSLA
jgi:protease PrsW